MTAAKTTQNKIVTIGGIDLEFNAGADMNFVPHDNVPYSDTNNILPTLAYAIKENMPVLMIGETGTGKTSAIRDLAKLTNNEFRRVNLNGSTTVEELVGKILINKDGTYWVDGVLTEAMRDGKWLLLDEVNAALPEVLFVLQSVLDDDRFLVLAEKEDKEVVKMHPNFRIFATMNPFEDYVGTKELNKAFLSRFPITIKVAYPTKDQEKQILRARFPDATKLTDAIIDTMVGVCHNVRDSKDAEDLDFIFSTRDLIQWAQVQLHTQDPKLAAKMTFLPKCNKNDAQAISNILNLEFLDENIQFTDMRKGSAFKLKAHVVVPNSGKVIVAGSVLSIVDWMKVDNSSGATSDAMKRVANGVKIRIERAPSPQEISALGDAYQDPANMSRIAQRGSEWVVETSDFNGKFVPTKA